MKVYNYNKKKYFILNKFSNLKHIFGEAIHNNTISATNNIPCIENISYKTIYTTVKHRNMVRLLYPITFYSTDHHPKISGLYISAWYLGFSVIGALENEEMTFKIFRVSQHVLCRNVKCCWWNLFRCFSREKCIIHFTWNRKLDCIKINVLPAYILF